MEIEILVDKGIVKVVDDGTKYLAHSVELIHWIFHVWLAKPFTKSLYYYLNFAEEEAISNIVHQRGNQEYFLIFWLFVWISSAYL